VEISITEAETWSCIVKVQVDQDVNGNSVTRSVYQFGNIITSPNAVAAAITRAQALILNPQELQAQTQRGPETVLSPITDRRSNQREFSKNSISLDIRGPELIGLRFIDLPGIIRNAGAVAIIPC